MPSLFDTAFQQYQNGWNQRYAQNPYADFSRHIDDIKAEQKALADGGVRTVGQGGAPAAPQPNYPNTRTMSPTPGTAPFVGAPLGAKRYDASGKLIDETGQPVSDPSELASTDTSGLAASGEGRANLSAFDPKLTDIGGDTAGVAAGFEPLQSLTGSLSKQAGRTGQGGGSGGANQMLNYGGVTGQPYVGPEGAGVTGRTYTPSAGTGGAGGGGMFGGAGGGAAAGSAAAGVLSSFADVVAKAMSPVTVDPTKWAGAIPSPVYYTPPTLARNTGGTWNY
jgi:hypothetical protein